MQPPAAALAPARTPHYADYPIDRAAELRTDAQALASLFDAPQARLLPLLAPSADGTARVLVVSRGAAAAAAADTAAPASYPLAPAWVRPAASVAASLADGGGLPGAIFLGLDDDGAGVFAGRVRPEAADAVVAAAAAAAAASSIEKEEEATAPSPSTAPPPIWLAARTAGPDMLAGDAALVATAAGLASWHAGAQFDGRTGFPTAPRRAGHSRGAVVPPEQAASASPGSRPPRALYPRVDPATIMLVREGAWALLGRKGEWPAGRWSTLAGFVECGETFEQCVAREVLEESGVPVSASGITYVESQPWPFPRSLMVGFYARPEVAAAAGAAGVGDGEEGGRNSGGGDPYALLPAGAARRAAMDVGVTPEELRRYLLPRLPEAKAASSELEDARWFFRGWVRRALERHRAQPAGDQDGLFHVPGHYSLGNRLVHGWLAEGNGEDAAGDEEEDDARASPLPPLLGSFASADIGEPGTTFKYVLLRVTDGTSGCSKLAVWGHPQAEYHNHVLQRAKARAASIGLGQGAVDVLGGGRIRREAQADGGGGAICVYGYSAAFGPSPHEVSAAILRRWFPFSEVTVSYDGY